MAKLSLYTTGLDAPRQDMVWDYWTDEEKSYVVWQGYDKYLLKSSEVKEYLWHSRMSTISNFAFPLVSYLTFSLLKRNLFKSWVRKYSYSAWPAIAFVGTTTLLWLNLSPYYTKKEQSQHNMLKKLYERIGPGVNSLNDILPRFWTSSSIDKRLRRQYYQRNNPLTGYLFAPEDCMAPIKPTTKYDKFSRKLTK